MVADTGLDRKTIVDVRQSLIEQSLMSYTGRMVGRSKQIPEMKLNYVEAWEKARNSPRLKDDESVDNMTDKTLDSTENGTGTSPKNGTGTSTENGTLNSSLEYNKRSKSFIYGKDQKKSTLVDNKPIPTSHVNRDTMSEEAKKATRGSTEAEEKAMLSLPKGVRPSRYRNENKAETQETGS
jgi:hypothetical protein